MEKVEEVFPFMPLAGMTETEPVVFSTENTTVSHLDGSAMPNDLTDSISNNLSNHAVNGLISVEGISALDEDTELTVDEVGPSDDKKSLPIKNIDSCINQTENDGSGSSTPEITAEAFSVSAIAIAAPESAVHASFVHEVEAIVTPLEAIQVESVKKDGKCKCASSKLFPHRISKCALKNISTKTALGVGAATSAAVFGCVAVGVGVAVAVDKSSKDNNSEFAKVEDFKEQSTKVKSEDASSDETNNDIDAKESPSG